jgi:thiol-disulfide isomerase/thioredoxin
MVQQTDRYTAAVLGVILACASVGGASVSPSGVTIPIPHPLTMLLHSASARRELALSVEQAKAIGPAVDQGSLSLWRLRDLPPGTRDPAARPLVESLRTTLAAALTPRQLARLDQLMVRAMGVQAVLEPSVAAALGLSGKQRGRLLAVVGATVPNSQDTVGERARRQQEALALLTERQRRMLLELMGPPFDVSALPAVACQAPELEGVTEWINSPPLTLASLRGKVVVVHFYTFGCINCIRNLPHYNEWRERFDRDRLVIIGIHRPETQKEYDIAEVRRKAAETGLEYPIAVDNESRNWNAWANRVWPSVYLIDKSGFVRYWWYGELNWQSAQGDQWMRSRITELLAARD